MPLFRYPVAHMDRPPGADLIQETLGHRTEHLPRHQQRLTGPQRRLLRPLPGRCEPVPERRVGLRWAGQRRAHWSTTAFGCGVSTFGRPGGAHWSTFAFGYGVIAFGRPGGAHSVKMVLPMVLRASRSR